jgi:hypothetical protein
MTVFTIEALNALGARLFDKSAASYRGSVGRAAYQTVTGWTLSAR